MDWDNDAAHSAIYDAEQTARLFCAIVNRWRDLETMGSPAPLDP
jgi:ribonuclease T